MKKEKTVHGNARLAILFFAFLILIVVISFVIKAIVLVKESRFDGSRRFTLTISNNKTIEALSVNPVSKKIAIFKFKKQMSSSRVGQLLKIPIDGYIFSNELDLEQRPNLLFNSALIKLTSLKTNLTIIDLFKLSISTKNISDSSVDNITIKNENNSNLDQLVENLVVDPLIENDHQTIRVVNATSASGLGGRLAKLITNMGGNVILVVTEDNPKKKSAINFLSKKTYTVDRLQKILGYEIKKGLNDAMSDITIIIGEDSINSLIF